MPINQKKYNRIIAKCNELKSKKQRSEGANEQILKRLKEKFGVKNIKEAESLLESKQNLRAKLLEKYENELDKAEKELE